MAAVERTVSGLGRLDTVVNNAGVMLLGAALKSPTDEWDRTVALNAHGSVAAEVFAEDEPGPGTDA